MYKNSVTFLHGARYIVLAAKCLVSKFSGVIGFNYCLIKK